MTALDSDPYVYMLRPMSTKSRIALSILVAFQAVAASTQALSLCCNPTSSLLKELVLEALAEGGFTASLMVAPSERSLQLVESGAMDAEFFRTEGAIASSPSLVRVDVPLLLVDYVAVSTDRSVLVRDSSDLPLYTVAVVSGNRAVEAIIGSIPTTKVTDDDALVKMLASDRVKVIITTNLQFPVVKRVLPAAFMQAPPLVSQPVYFVVNRRRAELIPRLEALFKRWVESGRWQAGIRRIYAANGF
jgi:hypothetical protein